MFVSTNKVGDLKKYFNSKLENQFSQNELKLMFQLLLEKRLNCSKEEIFLQKEVLLSESDLLYFRENIHKLVNNEPFQYLIGETEFYGLKIKCDSRALIPRPETEELVNWIDETFANKKCELKIIDFCTGSACIALALKSIFAKAEVSASDVSIEALSLAQENSNHLKLSVNFFNDNLLETKLDFEANSLDCIVSNPPYIPIKDKELMHENVLKYEPHLALFVENNNATIFYEKISEIASKTLKENAFLFFEIHENLAQQVIDVLNKFKFKSIELKQDLQGKNRMIRAQKA
jgi:release factor glutamine methyltransferase